MKKFVFLGLFQCLFLFSFAQKEGAYEQYMAGVSAYEKNQYTQAIQLFNEAEDGGIQFISLHNYRGICYYHLHQYQSALKDYEKALRLDPGYYAALSNKCNVYYYLKEYDKAGVTARTLIKKKVYQETAYNTLGNIAYDFKRYPEAFQNYRKALEYDSDQSCSYYNIGNTFFQLKNYDSAIVYHLQAREKNPGDLKNLNNLAMCYSNLHRIEESIAVSNYILSIDSNFYQAYAEIGFALMDNTNYNPNEVLPYLLKAVELAPDIVFYSYNNLGNVYFRLGLHPKALAAYSNAIRIDPRNIKSYSGMADIYRDSMMFDKAIENYMMAIHIDSNYNYPNLSLGGIMLRLGQKEASENYYRKYVELSADKIKALGIMYNSKAYNQLLVGDYEGCLQNTERSLLIDPKYAYAWNNRGFALAKTGKADSAFICFELSLGIDPYNSYVYHNRAFAYSSVGNFEMACKDLAKAKEMHFPVRIDPSLIELNRNNCHLNFSSKVDTVVANLSEVIVKVEAQQKVVYGSPVKEISNQSESAIQAEKLDWIQQIFPNPATNEFSLQLKLKIDKPMQIQVLGLNGSVNKILHINETGKQLFSFNCSDWASGTYILLLQVEGRQVGIGKVAIQH